MTKRTAPYRHPDKSPCWTKNCSRGNLASNDIKKYDLQRALAATYGENFTHIDNIAPIEDFMLAIKNKEISASPHPTLPYLLLKYSQETQYKKNWTDVTLAARGLIINTETGEIVARPFTKFFNYSEHVTPEELMTGPFTVADKLDGSLGISYNTPNGINISTAGGFQSEQGKWATEYYKETYEGRWTPKSNLTYMWEIIYPENRIVVNYGDKKDLYLLGAVDKRTGRSVPLKEITEWKGKRADEYPEMKNFTDVINSPDRENREGYIVHFTETDTRVKIKHDEYIKVHRFATGVNSRRIWEAMAKGDDMEKYKSTAPEEFEDYIKSTQSKIQKQYDAKVDEIRVAHKNIVEKLPANYTKRDLVEQSKDNKLFHYILNYETTKEVTGRYSEKLWDQIKPPFEKSLWQEQTNIPSE